MSHPQVHWHFEAGVLLALGTYAVLYAWRFRAARVESGGRGAGWLQAAAFAGGLLALAAALVSPIDGLGEDYVFSMHMVQHLLLGDIAPLLLLLSLSRVMMRPATRRLVALERALGPLAHPVTGIGLWIGLLYLWHVPALYDAALDSALVHALEHLSFFAAGVAVWWPLVQPVPMRRPLSGVWTFVYVLAAKLAVMPLGVYLAWSGQPAYDHYETVPRIWGLSVTDDQNVGGAIMMLEQSLVLVVALAVLFARMLTRSEADERRRERLEDIAAA